MNIIATFKPIIMHVIAPGFVLSLIASNGLVAATLDEQINDVKVHYATLEQTRADFQLAQSRGELGTTEQNDYAAWIQQLNDQLLHECQALMQTSHPALPDDLPCEKILASGLMPASINLGSERTEAEQTNGLIEELNATLGEFDERLLQEQARVKSRSPRTESTNSQSSGGGGESGSDSGSAQSTAEEAGDAATSSDDQSQKQGRNENSRASRGTAEQTGQGTLGAQGDIPEDIPDGSDDDVVARQLREAAEKETDPELKKKLWEEYRRYKEGTR